MRAASHRSPPHSFAHRHDTDGNRSHMRGPFPICGRPPHFGHSVESSVSTYSTQPRRKPSGSSVQLSAVGYQERLKSMSWLNQRMSHPCSHTSPTICHPSSQICSQCGHRDGRKPLDEREWECPNCGIRLDRDWNAALNILDAAGLAESLNARGGDVRRRLAQAGRNADAREAGTRRTVSLH